MNPVPEDRHLGIFDFSKEDKKMKDPALDLVLDQVIQLKVCK